MYNSLICWNNTDFYINIDILCILFFCYFFNFECCFL